MRIAVVGAGAIGGTLTHALARAGMDPLLIARGASADVIARDGLRVERGGVETVSHPRVLSDPADLGPHDVMIGALKAQDWAGAAALFAPLIGPKTIVIPAINGVPWWYFQGLPGAHQDASLNSLDPDGMLAKLFPTRCLIGCVVYMAASRSAPGVLSWPTGDKLILGELVETDSQRLPDLAAALRQAGLTIETTANIRNDMWMKLLSNATFNPISVLAEATMGEILGDPDLYSLCAQAMAEVMAVSAAVGCPMPITVAARMDMTRHLTSFRTSTLQDFEAGRSLELTALIDAPIELGRMTGVSVSTLAAIGHIVKRKIRLRDQRIER